MTNLLSDLRGLCAIVHGIIIHWETAPILYKVRLPPNREGEAQTRFVEDMLERIVSLDDAPLAQERQPEKRFAGSCSHFSLLLTIPTPNCRWARPSEAPRPAGRRESRLLHKPTKRVS